MPISFCAGKHRTQRTDSTEQQLQSQRIIIHPSYKAATFQFDIALLEMSEEARLNDYVMPVCFPDGSHRTGEDNAAVVLQPQNQFRRKVMVEPFHHQSTWALHRLNGSTSAELLLPRDSLFSILLSVFGWL